MDKNNSDLKNEIVKAASLRARVLVERTEAGSFLPRVLVGRAEEIELVEVIR